MMANELKLPKLKKTKEKKSKKKMLLLSDDLRMSSGVGTMSREIVLGTLHQYDWVQLGGAITHPETGKIIDMDDSVREETGVEDAHLRIYPTDGYGNQELVRQLIELENPDAILHYTDPRFWIWLYQMEHELRTQMPIFYYNIWDDRPAPKYNQFYYESCDLIMNISKQTVSMVKDVWTKFPPEDWQVTYVPHGINEDYFYSVDELHPEYSELLTFKNHVLEGKEYDFVLLYNSRNIRRKMPGDCVIAFKRFCDMLPKEEADRCAFLFHTQPVDENGTDLPAVVDALTPECNVHFSVDKLDNKHMNFLYSIADVTVNIASNEGFGLATCESMMCGIPIIVNVTGGLQDQCGFKYKGKHLASKEYDTIHTLHDYEKWENNKDLTWGEWVTPIWPRTRSLVGSPPTPYIFDDRVRWEELADKIKVWYDMDRDERKRRGELGRDFVKGKDSMMTAKKMCQNFIDHMERAFKNWKPRKRFNIYKT
jgi:glycosyltransferase involved in cell wall biosynthesis